MDQSSPTPVILELAVNGATPRSRNRHVPRTPAEIAEVALEGIALGASIVHNHNDEPMFTADGVHAIEPYLAAWQPILDRHPDVGRPGSPPGAVCRGSQCCSTFRAGSGLGLISGLGSTT